MQTILRMIEIDDMSEKLDKLLKAIPYDFPVCERPYRDIAEAGGFSERDLMEELASLKGKGVIRRIAAILYHRKADYTCNAMVVWQVPESRVEMVGKIMASFAEVSHCYERERSSYWDYNVFTMVHGRSLDECYDAVRRIAKKTGVEVFEMFLSKREFKKTSLMVGNE